MKQKLANNHKWAKNWLQANGYRNEVWALLALGLAVSRGQTGIPLRVIRFAKFCSSQFVKGKLAMSDTLFS